LSRVIFCAVIMTNRKMRHTRLSTILRPEHRKSLIWVVSQYLLIPSIFALIAYIIIYSLFYSRDYLIEGFTYQPYEQPTTATVTQNENNIQFLKDELDKLNNHCVDMSGNIVTLNEQVKGISEATASQADQLTNGNQPLNISTAT